MTKAADLANLPNRLTAALLAHSLVINGGMRVAQRAAAVTLSDSFSYGQVDRFACKADGTSVDDGTIAQNTSATIGSTGKSLQLSGVSITGASGTVSLRYRMEARDAEQFVDQPMTVAVEVLHNVGSAIDYVVTVNKADVADDFSNVTEIEEGSAQSVDDATATTVALTVDDMGACANGIEIIVTAECGDVTTKDFDFADFRVAPLAVTPEFVPSRYAEDLQACLRYYWRQTRSVNLENIGSGVVVTTVITRICVVYPVFMRTNPTMDVSDATHFEVVDGANSAVATTSMTAVAPGLKTAEIAANDGGGGYQDGDGCVLRFDGTAGAWIAFDAEL